MLKRRSFLQKIASVITLAPLSAAANQLATSPSKPTISQKHKNTNKPILLTTWNFGKIANEPAWEVLKNNGYALDAVEAGINLTELNPNERSVGLGGRPDRDGHVTLDACIMDENANIGAVLCMEDIAIPISVARKVMEKTPHVMLSGEGATQFALEQGFIKQNLLVEDSIKDWKNWLQKSEYKPVVNIENHDTIGMISMDNQGRLCGGCSTSGMAFKMRGRIGDSPIIGAGLFVDGDVGACTATGHGEEVVRVVGSFRVVEEMRHGAHPQKACEIAIQEIAKKLQKRNKNWKEVQIGFIAINKDGEYGAYSLQPGFTYAIRTTELNEVIPAKSLY